MPVRQVRRVGTGGRAAVERAASCAAAVPYIIRPRRVLRELAAPHARRSAFVRSQELVVDPIPTVAQDMAPPGRPSLDTARAAIAGWQAFVAAAPRLLAWQAGNVAG